MKVKEGFVVSKIGDKTVAVASGELCSKFNGMITLNESGKLLFEKLSSETTEDELVRTLTDEYGIGEDRARADVTAFLSTLRKSGLLE